MTSKALEAAAQELWSYVRPDGRPRFIAGLDDDAKKAVFLAVSNIIRAFAESLDEGAIDDEVWGHFQDPCWRGNAIAGVKATILRETRE